jgi:hypothetical protein
MLVNLATIEPILDFIAERWRVDHGKQQAPKQAMRFIRC